MNLRNAFALSVLGLAAISTPSRAEPLLGLVASGSQLVRFDSNSPTNITTVNISGLNGAVLRGIDLRPNDGRIFGVASNNQLYTVDASSGVATFVAALTVPLNPGADSFGVDFNPVPDSANPTMPSLRVVNNLDQNLRVQAVSGVNAPGTTFVDTNLNYQAGDVNFGQNPTVGEVAYTNNVPGATSTTLLGIDTRLNVLVQVTSANGGTLRTLGTLDGNFESLIGFDVSGFSGIGFAALTSDDGLTRLFTVNTSNAPGIVNNRATAVGLIGDGLLPLRGLMALTPGINAVPEPATLAMAGFGLGVVGLAAIRRRAKA